MIVILKKIITHYTLQKDKEKIERIIVKGNNIEECFKKIYEYERGSRYNNYVEYECNDKELQKAYKKWIKDNLTIKLYYGGAIVD